MAHFDHAEERRRRLEFLINQAEESHRGPLGAISRVWAETNDRAYGGVMEVPNFAAGHVPTALAACVTRTTEDGASTRLAFRRSLLIDPPPKYVTQPDGVGYWNYVFDLARRMTLLQKLMEVDKVPVEEGYHAYGRELAREINRVAPRLGLPGGVTFRGARRASGWPHAMLPDRYPGMTDAAMALAGVEFEGGVGREIPNPCLTVWRLIKALNVSGQTEALDRLCDASIARLNEHGNPRVGLPVNRAFERGEQDAGGMPINQAPVFDPLWLGWEGGAVVRLAEGIHFEKAYHHLPILGDALWEAGCNDKNVLDHLRSPNVGHNGSCFVLAWILETARAMRGG